MFQEFPNNRATVLNFSNLLCFMTVSKLVFLSIVTFRSNNIWPEILWANLISLVNEMQFGHEGDLRQLKHELDATPVLFCPNLHWLWVSCKAVKKIYRRESHHPRQRVASEDRGAIALPWPRVEWLLISFHIVLELIQCSRVGSDVTPNYLETGTLRQTPLESSHAPSSLMFGTDNTYSIVWNPGYANVRCDHC